MPSSEANTRRADHGFPHRSSRIEGGDLEKHQVEGRVRESPPANLRGTKKIKLIIESTRQRAVKGIPTVPRNSSSLESGADRIWSSKNLPAEDTCCTLKPTIANTTATGSTTPAEAPSLRTAA